MRVISTCHNPISSCTTVQVKLSEFSLPPGESVFSNFFSLKIGKKIGEGDFMFKNLEPRNLESRKNPNS